MKSVTSKDNSLLIPRIILTVSIVAVSVMSFYFITTTSNVLLLSSYLSKITSKQRTLCQQVINSIAADNIGGKLEGPPLEKTLENFVQSQTSFSKTDSILNVRLEKHNSHIEYINLDEAYGKLLKSISKNIHSNTTNEFLNLLVAENKYLDALDQYTSSLNGYSNAEVQTFKLKETSILLVSLLLVFLEIFLLFLPAVKKINKQNTKLISITRELQESHKLLQLEVKEVEAKNESLKRIAYMQSHKIRHPLSSIMGLIGLLKDGHSADKNWINMMCDAASQLDVRIQNIVKESDLNKEQKVIHYNKIVEPIDDYAIVLLDTDGNIENWNKGAEKVQGYKEHEVIGKNFSMFYTGEDIRTNHIYNLLEQATANGFIRDENWQVKQDGSKFRASTLIKAIRNNHDEIIGYTSVTKDLTSAGQNKNIRRAFV
ncbi:MAG: PAS domain S-box protein [Parafilimonas sp.]